jgi:hypothetical protein
MLASQAKVEVVNQPLPGMDKILRVLAETIEGSIMPLVRNMDKKLDIDLRNHEKMQEVSNQLRQLEADFAKGKIKSPKVATTLASSPTKPASDS